MKTFIVDHPHDEASALLEVASRGVLDRHGFDVAFWIVSDERPAHQTLALLGRASDGSFAIVPVDADLGARHRKRARRTDDAETLARAGSWVYVFGSQYGKKDGPLEPDRHYVARFDEALVRVRKHRIEVDLEIARCPFVLHRLVNDALRASDIDVLPPGPRTKRRMVRAALANTTRKRDRERLARGDTPINVEGATFLPGGHLLLGLRYPTTRDGHPILVEIEGIDRLFTEDRHLPDVVALHVVASIGTRRAPAGIRELSAIGQRVHAITGDLDSRDGAAILADHPEGGLARNEHWAFDVESGPRRTTKLRARRVRRFPRSANVEGLAIAGDRVWYVHDADDIRLVRARLTT